MGWSEWGRSHGAPIGLMGYSDETDGWKSLVNRREGERSGRKIKN